MRSEAGLPGVPRTARELAALEASYQPFSGAADWCLLHVDEPRLARYAVAVSRQRCRADARADAFDSVRDRLIRAATLESAALDDLLPASPQPASLVLAESITAPAGGDGGAAGQDDAEAVDLVAECGRRAMILAAEAAADGRPVDVNLIAVLQDMITESQISYTVTTDQGANVEVDLPKRQYKPVSNYLRLPDGELTAFTPASQVAAEMDRLVSEFGSAAFRSAHPVIQASYAHYALTAIHPFADGNGRLARTVASIYLIRAYGLPLVVFADQWPGYYSALNAATQGRHGQALVDHVSSAAVSVLDLAASLLAPRPPRLAVSGTALCQESQPDERGEAAAGLLDVLAMELRQLLAPPGGVVRLALTRARPDPERPDPAYRVAAGHGIRLAIRDSGRTADLEFVALVCELPGDLLPVAIREIRGGALFEVALADACPLVLESTALRAGLWARRLLAEALDQ